MQKGREMTRIQECFIENLKRERKKSGYSQERLAELIGCSPKYISALEIGKRFPSLDTLQKLIDVFNIEPYQLFRESSYQVKAIDIESIREFETFLAQDMPQYIKEAIKRFISH